jgi:hypothetical protein
MNMGVLYTAPSVQAWNIRWTVFKHHGGTIVGLYQRFGLSHKVIQFLKLVGRVFSGTAYVILGNNHKPAFYELA